jgi:non-homologous end joining protein Ku
MAAARPTASNVTVSFGLISFPVDLVPATRSKSTKAESVSKKTVCPTCTEPNPVSQVYKCEKGHGPFAKGDTKTALQIDGALHWPKPEQLAELAVADGVRGVVALTVHPAEQVEAHTMPAGNIYRLRPRDNVEHYALVLALVEDAKVAFLCEVTNKGATKLYRALARDGLLVLAELVRPSEFHQPDTAPDISFDPKLLATGRMLVETLVEEFDPATFADKRKARLVAMAGDVPADENDDRTDRAAVQAAADLTELIRQATKAA